MCENTARYSVQNSIMYMYANLIAETPNYT